MTRHVFFRILLSFLLLLSQQMAFAHALSHVAGVLIPETTATAAIVSALETAAQDAELSSAIAQEKSCHQCLSFAQLAGPLGTTPPAYAAPDLSDAIPQIALANGHWLRTVCVFRSRAPPQA